MRLSDADELLLRLKQPTKEEIKKVLREEYDNAPNDEVAAEAILNMYETVREAIKDAPTIESTRPDWTPCAEGMPYLSGNYIATYFNEITEKTYCDFLFFDAKQGRWKTPDGGQFTKYERVIAWQPLPEPYNPDRKED